MKKVNVVLAGLGFGACFLPIYLDHPMVGTVGILDTDPARLQSMKADYPNVVVYDSFEAVLADENADQTTIDNAMTDLLTAYQDLQLAEVVLQKIFHLDSGRTFYSKD